MSRVDASTVKNLKINLDDLFSKRPIKEKSTPLNIKKGSIDPLSVDTKEFFEERATIREFDGNQTRVEAELGAIEDVMPYLENGKLLNIPHNSPQKYRYWQGGQSIEETLRELGASEETLKHYLKDKTGGTPKKWGDV